MVRVITPVAAIIGIVTMECWALSNGMDGALFGLAVAAVSGLGGYEIKAVADKLRGNRRK